MKAPLITDTPLIPFCDVARIQSVQRAELEAATLRVLRKGAFILGEEVSAFERSVAARSSVRHAIGVGNGTDALTLALVACGIGRGDEVVVPACTYFAAVEAIHWACAVPRLVDVTLHGSGPDHDVSPAALERAIGPRTRAFIAPSLHGRAAEVEALEHICRERGVHMIEDACQAFGATRSGKVAGARGSAGAYSFYPTKVLGGAGDGGMLVTNDDAVAERVRSLRAHGAAPGDKYTHLRMGTNSRLDELQAAFLRVRLERLDADIARRRTVARELDARLERHRSWLRGPAPDDGHTYYAYVVTCEERDALREHLASWGIEAPVHFPIPLHAQPAFVEHHSHEGTLAGAERLCRTVLSLPCHPALREHEIERIGNAVDAFAGHRRGA